MKPRGAIPFRSIATDHLVKAKTLLEGGPDHEIYACLELRLALEAIAYEILQSYSDDLSEEVPSDLAPTARPGLFPLCCS